MSDTRMRPLTLVQLRPDLPALGQWAAATRQVVLRDDLGYMLHAATSAVLGSFAPKPFVLQRRGDGDRLLGYVTVRPEEIARAVALNGMHCDVAEALHLDEWQGRELPQDWQTGERFHFEVRAAPIVRSRNIVQSAYVEVDAAFHPLFGQIDSDGTATSRELAYGRWLAREFARNDAARLLRHELSAFTLGNSLRRHTRDGTEPRQARAGRLPEATLKGLLEVRDGGAFHALLARGVGRHRAFGFGCVLLASARS